MIKLEINRNSKDQKINQVRNLSFIKVAEASEIPLGKMRHVEVDGEEIMLVNVDGKIYAIGGPMRSHEREAFYGHFGQEHRDLSSTLLSI